MARFGRPITPGGSDISVARLRLDPVGVPSARVAQRAGFNCGRPFAQAAPSAAPHHVLRTWLSRWWADLPEADKAILTGAALLSIPALIAISYLFVSLFTMG